MFWNFCLKLYFLDVSRLAIIHKQCDLIFCGFYHLLFPFFSNFNSKNHPKIPILVLLALSHRGDIIYGWSLMSILSLYPDWWHCNQFGRLLGPDTDMFRSKCFYPSDWKGSIYDYDLLLKVALSRKDLGLKSYLPFWH